MSALAPILLAPLGALYGAVTLTRLALYRCGILPMAKLAAPVISVGNLTTGGTGKTPLVEFIARALADQGQRVCVLTRGYGRAKMDRRIVVSNGVDILADANEGGDEAVLLAEKLRGHAAVVCDADRFAAGEWAIANLGSEAFVLDDGFQHLRLTRDLNIAVIDASEPWGGGHLLPWGRLREPRRQLSRADCVMITRADQATDLKSLHREIEQLNPNKPVFTSRMTLGGCRQLGDGPSAAHAPLSQIVEVPQPIAVFCGIGNPTSFVAQLRGAGREPVISTFFRDHHRYSNEDIKRIVKEARAAGAVSLLTTAKDAVKLRSFSFELPCYVSEIEITIDDDSEFRELLHATVVR